MSIAWTTVLAVVVGMIIFKVLDKYVVTPLLSKVGMWDSE